MRERRQCEAVSPAEELIAPAVMPDRRRCCDGKMQSVQLQAGRLLGLGEKTVTIDGTDLDQLADRVKVMMNDPRLA